MPIFNEPGKNQTAAVVPNKLKVTIPRLQKSDSIFGVGAAVGADAYNYSFKHLKIVSPEQSIR
jgi:hypothetical protein